MIKRGENMLKTNDIIKNELSNYSNYINADTNFNIDILKELLRKKFSRIDYSDAKEDVLPFIKNTTSLNSWSKDFFISITNNLT